MGNAGTKATPDHIKSDERKKVYDAQDRYHKCIFDGLDYESVGPVNEPLRAVMKPVQLELGFSVCGAVQMAPVQEELNWVGSAGAEHWFQTVHEDKQVDINKHEFPFENLVFGGGGAKGLSYCGAVEILEETGIYKNIKRFAGSSAGAITAAVLAVGYNSAEINKLLSQDLSQILIDHSCWYFSLLPNLIRKYGWNPGNKFEEWFGKVLQEKTGNADVTFKQVYAKYGKELCVVVTNVNMMETEYFHTKTTPDIPVRKAVHMSMALPGMFQPISYVLHGNKNQYVDGGVLCNYPISCFDGWWLSMKKEDRFYTKLKPSENLSKIFEKKERFGTVNNATLGFVLYADNEVNFLKEKIEIQAPEELRDFPNTELAKKRKQANNRKLKDQEKTNEEYNKFKDAVDAFLEVLQKHNKDNDDKITKPILTDVLKEIKETDAQHFERLFGNITPDDVVAALDEDYNEEVDLEDLAGLIGRNSAVFQEKFVGYQRTEINRVISFFWTILSALMTQVERTNIEDDDIKRTVGINTRYVGTTDFQLEQPDKDFLIKQGRQATVSFLRCYVQGHSKS